MLGLRALVASLQNFDWLIKPALDAGLSAVVTEAALGALPAAFTSGDAVDTSGMKPVVLESNHPYEDNLNMYYPICIKGAKQLSVSFDPQSSTEQGCDYVSEILKS